MEFCLNINYLFFGKWVYTKPYKRTAMCSPISVFELYLMEQHYEIIFSGLNRPIVEYFDQVLGACLPVSLSGYFLMAFNIISFHFAFLVGKIKK